MHVIRFLYDLLLYEISSDVWRKQLMEMSSTDFEPIRLSFLSVVLQSISRLFSKMPHEVT